MTQDLRHRKCKELDQPPIGAECRITVGEPDLLLARLWMVHKAPREDHFADSRVQAALLDERQPFVGGTP